MNFPLDLKNEPSVELKRFAKKVVPVVWYYRENVDIPERAWNM
jgi:hypothetical protein